MGFLNIAIVLLPVHIVLTAQKQRTNLIDIYFAILVQENPTNANIVRRNLCSRIHLKSIWKKEGVMCSNNKREFQKLQKKLGQNWKKHMTSQERMKIIKLSVHYQTAIKLSVLVTKLSEHYKIVVTLSVHWRMLILIS